MATDKKQPTWEEVRAKWSEYLDAYEAWIDDKAACPDLTTDVDDVRAFVRAIDEAQAAGRQVGWDAAIGAATVECVQEAEKWSAGIGTCEGSDAAHSCVGRIANLDSPWSE